MKKPATIIEHDHKRYAVVPCDANTKCSFLDLDCDFVCNCPSWWTDIHSGKTLGLCKLKTVQKSGKTYEVPDEPC